MGERQRTLRPEDMATTSTAVTTVPPLLQEEACEPLSVITLRPARKEPRKKVVWTEDTVDNEHMNKKKSKCCCIYEKPRKFGESDSEESDDECEHCFGHVERRHAQPAAAAQLQDTPSAEPTATAMLRPVAPPSPSSAPPDAPRPLAPAS